MHSGGVGGGGQIGQVWVPKTWEPLKFRGEIPIKTIVVAKITTYGLYFVKNHPETALFTADLGSTPSSPLDGPNLSLGFCNASPSKKGGGPLFNIIVVKGLQCTCTRQFHFLICLQLCSHWSRSFAASLLLVERQEQEMTVQEMDFMHTAVSLSMGCKEIENFNKIVACQFPLASQSINCLPPHCSLLKLHSSLAVSSSSSFISQQFLSTVVSDSQGCGETFLASHLPQLRSFSFLDMYC